MKRVLPSTYKNPEYAYKRPVDFDFATPKRYPVVIVGAGPTGLTAALDLANKGIASIILSKEKTISIGSRAICFAKKTLEIINRISREAAEKMLKKGVVWNVGKVFYKEDPVYEFNLLPETGHKVPAFINLQQYYFEEYLVDAAQENPLIDLRWRHKLISLAQDEEKVSIQVETPEGLYNLEAAYLLACDGAHSTVRDQLGVPYEGEQFTENFLIADIVMESDFPTERWFWFDPPFNPGYSALLHKQPDGVWRIDLQLGRDIDKDKELEAERIKARLRQMLGEGVKFELEWTSIYQFRCMRMAEFVHGRIIFAGDSAHLVSPFGARGANSGVQDIDNLVWKLAYVLKGLAPKSLLTSYQEERSPATSENIYYSTSATDFISPKSEMSAFFRNAVLDLAKTRNFARQMVNSGRLSHPFRYIHSSLSTSDGAKDWRGSVQPGYSFKDLPFGDENKPSFLIDRLGNDFTLLLFHDDDARLKDFRKNCLADSPVQLEVLFAKTISTEFRQRYDVRKESWYLIRPDHYIAARGRAFDRDLVKKALFTAIGKTPSTRPAKATDKFPKYVRDEFYARLIKAHQNLTAAESQKFNAKLILLLLDKVESLDEFSAILEEARAKHANN